MLIEEVFAFLTGGLLVRKLSELVQKLSDPHPSRSSSTTTDFEPGALPPELDKFLI